MPVWEDSEDDKGHPLRVITRGVRSTNGTCLMRPLRTNGQRELGTRKGKPS